jgi:ribosomal-protein-alanine N-acetyltransferase
MRSPVVIELRGPRFLLRTLTLEEVTPRYLEWLHDPEVTKFLEVRFEAMTAEKLAEWVGRFDSRTKYLFGIRVRESGELIGTATLYDIRPIHGLANYGYMVGEKAYWGRGVVGEILPLLFDFAFDVVGVRKITTSCYAPHLASMVNYRKLGLHHEGTLRAHLRWADGFVDEHIYSINADQWRERRARLAEASVAAQPQAGAREDSQS